VGSRRAPRQGQGRAQGQAQGAARRHGASKTYPGSTPRPGYDDPRYRANREILKRQGNNTCHICGYSIDLQIKYPHPLSWSADHLIPRSQLTAEDPRQWDLAFLREAHYRCNSSRGDKPIVIAPEQQQTSIEW
jgi:5-methylcytosine-specific restriction endonuclease McrA